jgi:hypothetical protein
MVIACWLNGYKSEYWFTLFFQVFEWDRPGKWLDILPKGCKLLTIGLGIILPCFIKLFA